MKDLDNKKKFKQGHVAHCDLIILNLYKRLSAYTQTLKVEQLY